MYPYNDKLNYVNNKIVLSISGYYADQLSVAQEIRGNATISVKDEARGFHLNNLSYAGPIVMGFGGACSLQSKLVY